MSVSQRKGFTVVEVMIVSALMIFLAMLLSSATANIGKPAAELIGRGQLVQEMNIAVASLARDLGGALANPEGRQGEEALGRFVGWLCPSNTQLWLCFDGGSLNGTADWTAPDTVIVYQKQGDALVRCNQNTGQTFTVASNVDGFSVTSVDNDTMQIVLSLKYRKLTRSCTLIVTKP